MLRKTDIDKIMGSKSPIIDGIRVIFTYWGKAESVYLAGDYNQWELKDMMKKLEGHDIWYKIKQFPLNSRFDYKFIVDGNWITDPQNSNVTLVGSNENSTLVMPEYKSNYDTIINERVPRGNLISDLKFNSQKLDVEMKYHIYLPFEYEKGKINNILYAMDGSDYVNYSKINLILDYMIHKGEIPKMIVVLADPSERNRDYTLYQPYSDYIINELMPKVENEYMYVLESIHRSIIGVSWGGLTSISLAMKAPDKFNRVLSQSGSFWPKDWLIYSVVNEAPTCQIKFCLQTGTIQDTEEMNDAMYQLLLKKGYKVEYTRYAESHSWWNWKGHLDEGLRTLFSIN